MKNEKIIREIKEMFDISDTNVDISQDDDSDQAEEYGHSSGNNGSFNNLSTIISKEITNMTDKGAKAKTKVKEDPHDIVQDVCSSESDDIFNEERKGSSNMEKSAEGPSLKEDEDTHEEVPSAEGKKEDLIDSSPEEFSADDKSEETEEEVSDESPAEKEAVSPNISGDRITWSLESPSSLYDNFYKRKRELLTQYMIGDQVEYHRWMDELADMHVDISSEVFDQTLMVKQMEEIQQSRERIKYILIRVNNQFFMFKRFVEMLRGYLARAQYLKPQQKQDGLVMEHMRDVELYVTRLEALHNSAGSVEKVLAGAFDVLSRKVTISMELPSIERYAKKETPSNYKKEEQSKVVEKSVNKIDDSDMDDFDELPADASKFLIVKTGEIGWGEIS